METFSALLAICAGNSPASGEFPAQRPVTWSFDVFFDLCLNKLLIKQSWGWWFETLPYPLWRHCNDPVRSDPQTTMQTCFSYEMIWHWTIMENIMKEIITGVSWLLALRYPVRIDPHMTLHTSHSHYISYTNGNYKGGVSIANHYDDVIMSAMASQITSLTIVYSTVYLGTAERKHQAPRHWPLCREFTGDRWIPRTNGQWRGKCFNLMASSYVTISGGMFWPTSLCTHPIHIISPH